MSTKLALLKSGESVIADIQELISGEKVCGYLFTKPHVVSTRKAIVLTEDEQSSGDVEVSFTPWIVLSKDEKIPVSPEWIVTIVEPIDTIREMYEERENESSYKNPSSDEQGNLSE